MTIDMRDLDDRDRKKLINEGLSVLPDEVPSSYVEDPNTCPCVIEQSCEGIKDPDYLGKCVGGDLGYADCEIYQGWANGVEPSFDRSEELSDTVIMHGDEIVSNKSEERSVEETVNEGLSIMGVIPLSKGLRAKPSGEHTDYKWR